MTAPTQPPTQPAPDALLSMLEYAVRPTSGFAVVRVRSVVEAPAPVTIEFTIRRESWHTDAAFLALAWSQVRDGDDLDWHFTDYRPTLLRITRRLAPEA